MSWWLWSLSRLNNSSVCSGLWYYWHSPEIEDCLEEDWSRGRHLLIQTAWAPPAPSWWGPCQGPRWPPAPRRRGRVERGAWWSWWSSVNIHWVWFSSFMFDNNDNMVVLMMFQCWITDLHVVTLCSHSLMSPLSLSSVSPYVVIMCWSAGQWWPQYSRTQVPALDTTWHIIIPLTLTTDKRNLIHIYTWVKTYYNFYLLSYK